MTLLNTPARRYAQLLAERRNVSSKKDHLLAIELDKASGIFLALDIAESTYVLIPQAPSPRMLPAIRLTEIDVDFNQRLIFAQVNGPVVEGDYAVLHCRSTDRQLIHYLLDVISSVIVPNLAERTPEEVSDAIRSLALLFRGLSKSTSNSINGLYAELVVISDAPSPMRALEAWRESPDSIFDFSIEGHRLEVKSTSTHTRLHSISFEQANPPAGTVGIIISLQTERMDQGQSIHELITQIETYLGARPDLVAKLHRNLGDCLGDRLIEALPTRFDRQYTLGSRKLYFAQEIPAVRPPQPRGVSLIRFSSDLGLAQEASLAELLSGAEDLRSLLQ